MGIDSTARAARAATARIRELVIRTPLSLSSKFSAELDANIHFKLENRQTTGSFKLRGASNRLATLSTAERAKGCVAASSGNHGAAVACAMHKFGAGGVIFVPEQTSAVKVNAIRTYGGEVRFFGTDGLDTEQHARSFAERNDMTYLSPYNDAEVIAGQGTCGVEIVEQMPDVEIVFVAVGGGGLIGGVGSVLKQRDPDVRIIGCQPVASPVMTRSVEAGRIIDMPSEATLSDGTAGGIEKDAITFPLVRSIVDDFVLVDEGQIASAMCRFMRSETDTIEGAAGVAVAAMLESRDLIRGRNVVAIICGGNISDDKLAQVRATEKRRQ